MANSSRPMSRGVIPAVPFGGGFEETSFAQPIAPPTESLSDPDEDDRDSMQRHTDDERELVEKWQQSLSAAHSEITRRFNALLRAIDAESLPQTGLPEEPSSRSPLRTSLPQPAVSPLSASTQRASTHADPAIAQPTGAVYRVPDRPDVTDSESAADENADAHNRFSQLQARLKNILQGTGDLETSPDSRSQPHD